MTQHQYINYSNIFLNHRMLEDTICDLGIPDHCMIYVCSGYVDFLENGRKITVREGECAFIRRDHRVVMHKKSNKETSVYQSIVLKFTHKFLYNFYHKVAKHELPLDSKRNKTGVKKLENRPDIISLFESIKPFFNSETEPTQQWLDMKMVEGLYVLLNSDKNIYASLFDFTDPWKIDLIEFMNQNFTQDLSLDEMARYTGRSLTTFKRDFKKIANTTPQKWIIRKRLEAAHNLIINDGRKVKEVLFDVGFKNMSHFSRLYKETYGIAPSFNLKKEAI